MNRPGVQAGNARLTLTPLVGLSFSGSSLTEHNDLSLSPASLGTPVWNPPALLANLELRLGLPTPEVGESLRIQHFARRLDHLLAQPNNPPFYARSFAIDRLGTASSLLAMRDELVAAGWNGDPIVDGGERLATFTNLEGLDNFDAALPPGDADRLRIVEAELPSTTAQPFDALHLAEPPTAWPGRWQRVFRLLAERGVDVRHASPSFAARATDDDLARVQAALRGDARAETALRGDGSFIVLRGETSWELAPAVAALLQTWRDSRAVVLRGGDVSALDGALVAAGLGSQGLDSEAAWRPMLQVLPLAIELAFEPRDPYRVLELLTLPHGPFHGFVGNTLARALAKAPGIGGRPWRQGKETIAERLRVGDELHPGSEDRARETLEKIEVWFEMPGHSARTGAPRAALSSIADRVLTWLGSAYAISQIPVTGAAMARARAFRQSLEHDSRDILDLVDARLLLDQVSSRHSLEVSPEEAGRLDAADAPNMLRAARDTIVWWHCIEDTAWRPRPRPWRVREVEALRGANVVLADIAARLSAEGESWRRAVLAARKRLVLVVPRRARGEAPSAHPIVHEIMARLGRDEKLARVTVEVRDLLRREGVSIASDAAVPLVTSKPLELPEARGEWRVDAGSVPPSLEYSASSLEELVSCPLRSVLGRGIRLRSGNLVSIPKGPQLHGTLAHRVVEKLHEQGALSTPAEVAVRFTDVFERLLTEEASVLRRPGMTFELAQIAAGLERSLTRLSSLLGNAQLRVVDVEFHVEVDWRGRKLVGDLDLLLRGADGAEVVLDLKWGSSRYRDLLMHGRSIQLAAYVVSRKLSTGAMRVPRAGYFSLKRGHAYTCEPIFVEVRPLDGAPSLEGTWPRLERTVDRVEQFLASGRIPVGGVSCALPMLETLGVPPGEVDDHLELEKKHACDYCAFDAICGKRWEGFS